MLVFVPTQIGLHSLLKLFWEHHDPTQGMRQGNDRGTQYRSGIFCSSYAQQTQVLESQVTFTKALSTAGYGNITT